MITKVRDLAASDSATLDALLGLLKSANPDQASAIGTALGQVALMGIATDQAFATQIQTEVVLSGNTSALVAFSAVVGGDIKLAAATGPGGGAGGGIELPLKPFFGSMGLAPPPSAGKVNSAPPGVHAGNLDNKELVAGTTLFIPVHAPGALFEVGDGHAGMGNGEVDITAMETSLTGVFQFILHKDMHLTWPRAETPTYWITMGLDPDLTEATKIAVRETIDFLMNEKKLSREDAYMLSSVAVDFDITQLVDGTKGVHGMIPKSIFKKTN
jgi:acetamidase/formamidase